MAVTDVHVVQDGRRGAPTMLLLSNAAAPSASWNPLVPRLAEAYHVVRVDLIGHGRPPRYDVVTQARRVAAVLDDLGVSRATVAGHSSGCMVATALAEQRPDVVSALALIDMGPDLDAKLRERLLFRLIKTRFPGALLWRLRDPKSMVKAAGGVNRPVDIPDSWMEHLRRMTHRDFVGVMRAYTAYLPGSGAFQSGCAGRACLCWSSSARTTSGGARRRPRPIASYPARESRCCPVWGTHPRWRTPMPLPDCCWSSPRPSSTRLSARRLAS